MWDAMIGRCWRAQSCWKQCVVYFQECALSLVDVAKQAHINNACIYIHTNSGSLDYKMQSAGGSTEGDIYSEDWQSDNPWPR